jgi:hypothetical protein
MNTTWTNYSLHCRQLCLITLVAITSTGCELARRTPKSSPELSDAMQNFARARETVEKNACINNLRLLDGAIAQWALENRKQTGEVVTEQNLLPFVGQKMPVCPSGGLYTTGLVGKTPTCSIPGHAIP